MRLYYYNTTANFGDELNLWLWQRLLPDCWDPEDGIYFSGIGTIINSRMPAARRWIVFTSGAGYGSLPLHFGDRNWNIVSVRGPLSAAALRLPPGTAGSDGAMLLVGLSEYAPLGTAEREGVVFVPHHQVDDPRLWGEACRRAGVEYLSPRTDSREVVQRLRRARLVLADAMHAAIVADTLRVPWVPLISSPQINTFKWLDWTRSMDLPYMPVRLPSRSVASMVHDRLLALSGEHNLFKAGDDGSALAYFERNQRRRQGHWWPRVHFWGRRLQRRAVWLARTRPIASVFSRFDDRQLDRIAETLRKASESGGFLSQDKIFADRLALLSERLQQVRRLAA